MTCDARGALAKGLRWGRGKGSREQSWQRNRVSQLTWESVLPAAAAAASTVFKLLNLQQQFRLPHSFLRLSSLAPPPDSNACVRFIYAFINQLTKCKFLQRVEIKRRRLSEFEFAAKQAKLNRTGRSPPHFPPLPQQQLSPQRCFVFRRGKARQGKGVGRGVSQFALHLFYFEIYKSHLKVCYTKL